MKEPVIKSVKKRLVSCVSNRYSGSFAGLALLLFLLLIIVLINNYILVFQNSYGLDIGPGDKGYFSRNKLTPFGREIDGRWVRPMGQRSFINLPLHFKGEKLNLEFTIKSFAHQNTNVLIYNRLNKIIGSFTAATVREFQISKVSMLLKGLPEGRLDIKMTNASGRFLPIRLYLDEVRISSEKGADLPFKYTGLFILFIAGIVIISLFGGLNFKHSVLIAFITGSILTAIKFIDFFVYFNYLKILLQWGIPFLLLSALIIRLITKRNKLFAGESKSILFIIFLLGFLVHFFGVHYLYHFNQDGLLRYQFYQILDESGTTAFFQTLSGPHAAAMGASEGVIPYPPWFNLMAVPFVKLGFDIYPWLCFQALALTSFVVILTYALARRLNLSKQVSRWAALFSVFTIGLFRDQAYNAFDPTVSLVLLTIFWIVWFGDIDRINEWNCRRILRNGAILSLFMILHAGVVLSITIYFCLAMIYLSFAGKTAKLKAIFKIALIYAIGLILALVMFYGVFAIDIIRDTLPQALEMSGLKNVDNVEVADFSANFIGYFFLRMLWTFSLIMIPVLIGGWYLLRNHLIKRGSFLTVKMLTVWIMTYLLLLFLRTPLMLQNVFKHNPEHQFIYPLSVIVMAFLFIQVRESNNVFLKWSINSLIGVWITYNTLEFYLERIDMLKIAEKIPDWLKYFF